MTGQITFVFSLVVALTRAELIDRIAVAVDAQVITTSEINLEIRLTAFLNGDPLDFSPDARRKAANRLVEQKLIRKEMQVGRYDAPLPEEASPMLQQVKAQRFQSDAAYQQALEHFGVSEPELKVHLLWQLTLLRFIDLRFRPGVEVTDADIQRYFNADQAQLEMPAGSTRKLTLDDLRNQIRETLTSQGADKQLDDWMAEARKRARIEFHQEAFQ